MIDVAKIINMFSLFVGTAVLDIIPIGNFLVTSLTIGGIFSIVRHRVKGGK